MAHVEEMVREQLFALQDIGYREFHAKLIPTVNPERVIGVRTPVLRNFASEFSKTTEAVEFMRLLPHRYYDEDNLHGFLIEGIGEYGTTIAALDAFLPFVDNWATCDLMNPKIIRKHRPELFEKVKKWIAAEHTYTCRFAIGMLLSHFLEDSFSPEILEMVAAVASEEYYVRMMVAWFFATALHKQYAATIPYITEHRLVAWTHNKTIQKAVESYRITDTQKTFLRTLRVKKK